jgi:hypothetical protein
MSDESPIISSEPSNEKQIIVAQKEKHWAAWVLDIFVAIGAISQVGIGIVLICQLSAYEKSNKLTQESLKLTNATFKTSHIPWISAGEMTVGEPEGANLTVTIGFKNSSDTPAFHVKYFVSFVDDRLESANTPLSNGSNGGDATWMPGTDYSVYEMFAATEPAKIKEGIEDGDIVLSTSVTYEDIFGGKFRITETWNKQNGRFINPESTVEYPDYSKQ